MLSISMRLKTKTFQTLCEKNIARQLKSASVIQLLQVGVLKTGWATWYTAHLRLWPESPMTQHERITDTDICLSSLFIRGSLWNVRVCSASSACGQVCVAQKQPQHEAMRNATPLVGVCRYVYTYKGHRDYGSRAWRPAASLRITGSNQVNRPCLHRVQQQDDHPSSKLMFPTLLPTCPARSLLNDHDSFIWNGFIVISAVVIASSYV